MLGVVSDRWVGRGAVGPALIVGGESGKKAVVPRQAAVGGSGKAYVAAAPADIPRPASHVESAHKGISPGERVGLDFRFVRAVCVGQGVHADPGQGGLCVSWSGRQK